MTYICLQFKQDATWHGIF